MKPNHQPVLVEATLDLLDPKPGQSYLDLTAGYGGHAAAVLDRIGNSGRVVLVDRDSQATSSLNEKFDDRVEIRRANYLEAAKELVDDGSLFDLILLDLGVSSPQLDNPERGFSFSHKGPLDMRMDRSQGLTAAEVVNNYTEKQLADIIYRYGEERHSRRVARAIVAARPLVDTAQLARVIRQAVPKSGDIDAATRSFQAIRIEVNQELAALEQTLPLALRLLTPGGRLAVISFHSLEDRLVKKFFDYESRDCICPPKNPVCVCDHKASLRKLTSRAIKGTDDTNNPRARSAKLRAAEKINQNQKEGT